LSSIVTSMKSPMPASFGARHRVPPQKPFPIGSSGSLAVAVVMTGSGWVAFRIVVM
jgi:hypothetical protein